MKWTWLRFLRILANIICSLCGTKKEEITVFDGRNGNDFCTPFNIEKFLIIQKKILNAFSRQWKFFLKILKNKKMNGRSYYIIVKLLISCTIRLKLLFSLCKSHIVIDLVFT